MTGARINSLDRITFDIVGELRHARDRADRSRPVPLGMQRVGSATARQRLQRASRAELQQMLSDPQIGVEGIMALLK